MDDKNDELDPIKKYGKRYGKHSVWWWIVVYVIAAIIVYGIVYLIFFRSTGGSSVPGY
jgi:flagellar basal body-associated protein FliL